MKKSVLIQLKKKCIVILPATILGMSGVWANAQTNVPENVVEIPAITIISESISALSPTFGGTKSPPIMAEICAYASGSKKNDDLKRFFTSKSIDIDELAKEDKGFALLASGDLNRMKTACAAYISASVLDEPDLNEFMLTVAAKSDKNSKKEVPAERQINDVRLKQVLSKKLIIAQMNSAFFATIAAQLNKLPATTTLSEYRKKTQVLFAGLAPFYLANLGSTPEEDASISFDLISNTPEKFIFSSSTGYVFDYTNENGLQLKVGGINWYGNGEMLGKKYMINVAYLPKSIIPVIKAQMR